MKKYLLILLIVICSISAKAQYSEFYKRKVTDSFDIAAGATVGLTVKITDSLPGGLWMQTTRTIPFGTTVRSAIASGWLVLTSAPTTTKGPKSSDVDPGTLGDISLTDSYMYICVHTGTAGSAIWRKVTLLTTP